MIHPCPQCGTAPVIEPQFYGVAVYCDQCADEHYDDGDRIVTGPRAWGKNREAAIESWQDEVES